MKTKIKLLIFIFSLLTFYSCENTNPIVNVKENTNVNHWNQLKSKTLNDLKVNTKDSKLKAPNKGIDISREEAIKLVTESDILNSKEKKAVIKLITKSKKIKLNTIDKK